MYLHVFKYTTLPIVLLKFKIKASQGSGWNGSIFKIKTRTNILLIFCKGKGFGFCENFFCSFMIPQMGWDCTRSLYRHYNNKRQMPLKSFTNWVSFMESRIQFPTQAVFPITAESVYSSGNFIGAALVFR